MKNWVRIFWGESVSTLSGNHIHLRPFKEIMPGFPYQEAEASNELMGDNPRQERLNKERIWFIFRWRILDNRRLRETIIKGLIRRCLHFAASVCRGVLEV